MNASANRTAEHRFFSAMSVTAFVLVFTGFANTYGRRLVEQPEPIGAVVHIHALLFSCWMIAFVGQVLFVLRGRLDLHRKFGQIALPLAAAMLISGVATAREAARSGRLGIPGVMFEGVEGFFLLNLASAIAFFSLAVLGWLRRDRPDEHKRLMLLATVVGLAPPGISRLPLISGVEPAIGAVTIGLILLGPLYDWKTRGRPHRIYAYAIPFVIAILPPVVQGIGASAAWKAIASVIIGGV